MAKLRDTDLFESQATVRRLPYKVSVISARLRNCSTNLDLIPQGIKVKKMGFFSKKIDNLLVRGLELQINNNMASLKSALEDAINNLTAIYDKSKELDRYFTADMELYRSMAGDCLLDYTEIISGSIQALSSLVHQIQTLRFQFEAQGSDATKNNIIFSSLPQIKSILGKEVNELKKDIEDLQDNASYLTETHPAEFSLSEETLSQIQRALTEEPHPPVLSTKGSHRTIGPGGP